MKCTAGVLPVAEGAVSTICSGLPSAKPALWSLATGSGHKFALDRPSRTPDALAVHRAAGWLRSRTPDGYSQQWHEAFR